MTKLIEESGILYVNEEVGPQLYRMEIGAPEIARSVEPGQFIHAKLPGMEGRILRRPFSVYAATPELGIIELLYQVVGYGTYHMTKLDLMDRIDMIGPVGTGWTIPQKTTRALLVGGGVGAAPLFMLAEKLVSEGVTIDIILGAQSGRTLVCHDRYENLLSEGAFESSSLCCATDDGSFGQAGFCTDLVEEALETNSYEYAAVCGPEPMMRIASAMIRNAAIPCELSFEKRMACGIGACLSCVVETTEGLKRACVDGPVFDAEKVVFA